jgi:hypothetical protein
MDCSTSRSDKPLGPQAEVWAVQMSHDAGVVYIIVDEGLALNAIV